MGIATFKTVAAGDGSPQSAFEYRYYLLVHAIATALMLIALVAAIWQFMDWIVAPACPKDASPPSASSSTVAASHRYSGGAESALDEADCPCPRERQREKV
jgi:hypothetical protein